MRTIPITPLLLLLSACAGGSSDSSAPVPDRAALLEEILQADRDFALDTAERGAEGWASWFTADGMMVPATGPEVVGPESILLAMAPAFGNPGYSLSWDPRGGEVAASGDLGYTWGEWVSTTAAEDAGVTQNRGRYVSVWRRQADGSWKVALDLGNTDHEPPPDPPGP